MVQDDNPLDRESLHHLHWKCGTISVALSIPPLQSPSHILTGKPLCVTSTYHTPLQKKLGHSPNRMIFSERAGHQSVIPLSDFSKPMDFFIKVLLKFY